MSSGSLNVARPGDLIWPGTRISPIKWHVGGQPWFPAECGAPNPSQLTCGVCGERLKHILHVALPPEEDSTSTHALMYLYVCTKLNCGKEPGSWRALRCQWHSPTPEKPTTKETSAKSNTTKAKTLSTSGWGLGDTSSDNNTKPASSGFDFSDLEAALDAMNKKPASTSSVSSAKAEKEQQVELNLLQAEDDSIPLPGFYLDVAESQIIENRIEKQNGKSGGGGGRNNKEEDQSLAYIHELLEQYGAQGDKECLINYNDDEEDDDEEETRDKKSRKQKPAPHGGGGRSTKAGEETADPITWNGEGYEEDAVLAVEGRKGVDQSFLKFMKKLQRIPDQCVRQGRRRERVGGHGGDQELLLWPSSKKIPESDVCSSCGATRVFEYQLMAPTIAAIEESADWLKEEGLEDGAVERPPVTWDWVTVAVFGCRERCSGGSDGVYREEKVVVCEEE